MDNINYLEIFKKAWKITWQNKYLWWFGLFMMLGSGGSMNGGTFSSGSNDSSGNVEEFFQKAETFISDYLFWIIVIAVAAFLLLILLWVLRIIAQAGLIKIFQNVELVKEYTFGKGMKMGKEYFWRLAGMSVLLNFSVTMVVIVMIIPIAFLFYLKSYILAVLSGIIAAIILIPLLVAASFLGKYGQFYVVVSNLPIRTSLEMAYAIFRKNILPSIVMSLLFIPIGIIMVVGFVALVIVLLLVFVLLGFLFSLIFGKVGIMLAVALGVLICLGAIFFVGAGYQVFWQASWWLFFQEIAGIKITDEEKKLAAANEILVGQEN